MRWPPRLIPYAVFTLVTAAISVSALAPTASAQGTAAKATPVSVVDLTPAQGALPALLTAEIAKARKAGLTPFVELGATWCGPCKSLKASLGDSLMIDAFAGVSIIRLDIDAWKGSLEPLGLISRGVPAFLAIDSTGRASGPNINGGAWAEDIPVNMAPPLKAFFRANLTSVQKGGRSEGK